MPLYEYQCEACSRRFEKIQKFSDAPIETCPECGGRVKKLPSSPAIQFKGSGWYITDYAKKSSGDGSTAGGEAADKAEKADKSEKSDKSDKAEKAEKAAKSDSSGSASESSSKTATPPKE
jgi:putative FmdB family regulatory protein